MSGIGEVDFMIGAGKIVVRHRYAAQVLLIIFTTAVLQYASIRLNYRGGWNAVWMLLLPVALAFTLNRDFGRGAFMALTLPIVSIITVLVAGVMMGGY